MDGKNIFMLFVLIILLGILLYLWQSDWGLSNILSAQSIHGGSSSDSNDNPFPDNYKDIISQGFDEFWNQ